MTENTKRHLKRLFSKDFFFYVGIFLVIAIYGIFHSNNLVKVEFQDTSVDVNGPRYSMNIPYDMIESAEIIAAPAESENVDGRDDSSTRTGLWKDETLGEYYACIDLASESCIAVRLSDGRVFVFSRNDAEETTEIFETLQGYLN